jgi:hypothetical protein
MSCPRSSGIPAVCDPSSRSSAREVVTELQRENCLLRRDRGPQSTLERLERREVWVGV